MNALEILMSSINSINIYGNDDIVEKPSVSAFQNFLRIENWLNIKKVMGRNVEVFCIDSVDIDSIECIRDPCPVLTVLTYIVLMVWLKSLQSQLSNTFCLQSQWIDNRLNIKKVMAEMCGCVLY